MTLLKRTSTPKSIAKAFRGKRSKVTPDVEKEQPSSRRASDDIVEIQAEIYASGNEKKKYLDKAIDQYITGSQSLKLIDELSKKHEKLDAEKKEYLTEREKIISESMQATDNVDSTHEAIAQDLDDNIETINSELAYINARIRALQNETRENEDNAETITGVDGAPLLVSESRRSSGDSQKEGNEKGGKDPKMDRRKSSDSKKRLSLPHNAPPQMAYDTAMHILRNLDAFEQQAVLEAFLKDIVDLRTGEWSRQMTLAYQEKTIRELNKNLLAMRRAAVSKTLLYETKIKQLEEELRYGGRTPSPITPTGLELEVANIEHDASNTMSLFDKIYENSKQQIEAAVIATGGVATPGSIEEYERATSSKRNSVSGSGSNSKRNSIALSGSGSNSKRNSLSGDLEVPKRNSIPLGSSGSNSNRRNSYFGITDDYMASPTAYSPNSPTNTMGSRTRTSFSQPPLPQDFQLQLRDRDSHDMQPSSPSDLAPQLQRRSSRESIQRRDSRENLQNEASIQRRDSRESLQKEISIQRRDSRENLQKEVLRRAASGEYKSRTWSDGEYSSSRARHQKQSSDPTNDHIKWADGGEEEEEPQPQAPPVRRKSVQVIQPEPREPRDQPKNHKTHQRRGSLRDSVGSSTSMGFYAGGSPDHEASNRDSGYFSDKRRSQSSMARRNSKDLSHLRNQSWNNNRQGSPDSDDASSVTSERMCHSRSQTPTGENVFDRLSKGSTVASSARSRSKSYTQERRGSIHRETLAALEGRRLHQGTS